MKHNKLFTFNYLVYEVKSLEINLEELANLILQDLGKLKWDTNLALKHFCYNMRSFLVKLGLSENTELGKYDLDYLYESIQEDLANILEEKKNSKE